MPYVFGPVPSRRLGLSLGIDLIPPKTCTYNCLYCQIGLTNHSSVTPKPFVPVQRVIEEIQKKLNTCAPDALTLAGSGEPTLHSEIDLVIAGIKKITDKRVVLLTNGSLLWKKDVRERILGADIIMPTLTSTFDDTFRKIHRPHPDLHLAQVLDGLKNLKKYFKGQVFLEVFLISGINDTEEELEGLKTFIDRLSPEKIQLNTVVRPPSDSEAKSLDTQKLKEIMAFFGKKAEIVAEPRVTGATIEKSALMGSLVEMVKRRPLNADDISNALGLTLEEVEDLVKGLLIKGIIRKQEHSGDTYYLIKNGQTTKWT